MYFFDVHVSSSISNINCLLCYKSYDKLVHTVSTHYSSTRHNSTLLITTFRCDESECLFKCMVCSLQGQYLYNSTASLNCLLRLAIFKDPLIYISYIMELTHSPTGILKWTRQSLNLGHSIDQKRVFYRRYVQNGKQHRSW